MPNMCVCVCVCDWISKEGRNRKYESFAIRENGCVLSFFCLFGETEGGTHRWSMLEDLVFLREMFVEFQYGRHIAAPGYVVISIYERGRDGSEDRRIGEVEIS